MEKFEYVSSLGEGAYGTVWLCKNQQTNELVALKRFKDAHTDPEVMRLALREIRLLKASQHMNVVKLLEAFRSKSGRVYIVQEYVERTLTQDLRKYTRGFPSMLLKVVTWQLLQAVSFLHKNKIIHRDLKPANILLTHENVVKICDFGFARNLHPKEVAEYTTYVVTRWYRPPEILVNDEYGPKVDVWAIGCLLAEMATGRPMFPGKNSLDQLYLTMRTLGRLTDRQMAMMRIDPTYNGLVVPPLDEQVPLEQRYPQFTPDMMQLLRGCLALDPEQRLSADEALAMPYFDDVHIILAELASKQRDSGSYWATAELLASAAAVTRGSYAGATVPAAAGSPARSAYHRASSSRLFPMEAPSSCSSSTTNGFPTPPYAPAVDRRCRRQQVDVSQLPPTYSQPSSCSAVDPSSMASYQSVILPPPRQPSCSTSRSSNASGYAGSHEMVSVTSTECYSYCNSNSNSNSNNLELTQTRSSRSFNAGWTRRPLLVQPLTINEESSFGSGMALLKDGGSSRGRFAMPLISLSDEAISPITVLQVKETSKPSIKDKDPGVISTVTNSPPDCVVTAYQKPAPTSATGGARAPAFKPSTSVRSRLSANNKWDAPALPPLFNNSNSGSGMLAVSPTTTPPRPGKKKMGFLERFTNKLEAFFGIGSSQGGAGSSRRSRSAKSIDCSSAFQDGPYLRSSASGLKCGALPAIADGHTSGANTMNTSSSSSNTSWHQSQFLAANLSGM